MTGTSQWVWVVRYAAAVVILIAGLTWLLGLHYTAPAERHALLVAAEVAAVLQIVTFVAARRMALKNPIAGWGLGAACCITGLFVFGFVVRGTGMPLDAALLGFASFLFVTELVEPLFLRP
jgi:hypothetical protein